MKKVLTILSIFVSVILGGVFLVSCSNGYGKMYLAVECLVYENGEETWKEVDGSTDYYLSSDVYSEQDGAYLLYLRVKVKGTSKKVSSIFISMSANNSAGLENDTIKPNEAFKVLVNNVGSINFSAVPSEGGSDKAVNFGVNVYRKLEGVEQNKNCVPAVVAGGDITFGTGNLTGLIKYAPFDPITGKSTTNQTGVNYTIEGVGTLVDGGESYLIERNFQSAGYVVEDNVVIKDDRQLVHFANDDDGRLMLRVEKNYPLTTTNNVIKLKATSVYNEAIACDVYVYIVENYKDKFLVSYNNDVTITNNVIADDDKPVGNEVTIYDAILGSPYRSASVYAYVGSSIYSFISEPGMRLKVYVDGVQYDYQNNVESNLGIKISPAKCKDDVAYGLGLKFETTDRDERNKTEYAIKVELDFTAFDFSGSDTSPMAVLTKEFTLKVSTLASGFNIKVNGGVAKTYADNLGGTPENLGDMYSYYAGLGMPLTVQATPTNRTFPVKVAFFETSPVTSSGISGTPVNYVQLLKYQNVGVGQSDGWFLLDTNNTVYLNFMGGTNLSHVSNLYMVCSAVCTPSNFQGASVDEENIYFVSKFDIVGAVKNLYVYKDENDMSNANTFDDEFLQAGVGNIAYIGISAGAGKIDVDLSNVKVQAYPANSTDIVFSADGITWSREITLDKLAKVTDKDNYKLFFRGAANTTAGFKVVCENGVETSTIYKFVNVVTDADNVDIKFEKTYIWQSSSTQNVTYNDKATKINFLALQSNTSVKFEAAGDSRNANIYGISASSLSESTDAYSSILTAAGNAYYAAPIQNFSSRAVVVANQSSYFFDVQANSSGFTSVVLVKVDFYVKDDNTIKQDCKYFIYEIAVYNPANKVLLETDKDSLMYINDNFKDVARVTFTVNTNSATQMIYFSADSANDEVGIDINSRTRIYGVEVALSETMDADHFTVSGLVGVETNSAARRFVDIANNQFTIEAKKSFGELTYIYVDFTIYQFGKPTTYSLRKIIYLATHTKSEGIVVDGVDVYNNIYLSLQSDEQKTTQFTARVSNADATYKELGYALYTLNTTTGRTTPYSGQNLVVEYLGNDRFKVTTSTIGGTYQLTLYAKDSYDTTASKYTTTFDIVINVSAGTKENPYLLRTLADFEKIATGENLSKHYRLANDINLSSLSANWWNSERVFSGSLDGAMTIYDAEKKGVIQKQYILKELNISSVNKMTENYNAALFSSLTDTAEIKNVMLDRVKFDLTLNSENTGDVLNIAALAGVNNGAIVNSSVNIANSTITITESASRTTYNVGVLVATNSKTIAYDNSQTATNYSAMVDCSAGGVLNVIVERNGASSAANFKVNVGGIAGTNTDTITATYMDGSSQALKHLLSGVVNINFVAGSDRNEQPEDITANIGGAVGYNNGTIQNIAMSGLIRANDKVNIGGIAGENADEIIECANYGMVLDGYARSVYKPTGVLVYTEVGKQTDDYLLEQNIGGIVGINSGKVDNVRTLFVTFDNNEVSISARESYISGVGNVAGVIGKANATALTRAYVENFIEDSGTYNIIGNGVTREEGATTVYANVAGLIATGTGSVAIGFVRANISAKGCSVYEFGNGLTLNYVYFIGEILLNEGQTIGEANHAVQDNVYVVETLAYFDDDNTKKTSTGNYGVLANDTAFGEGESETPYSSITGTDFSAKWVKDDEAAEAGLINSGYPYLVYKIGEGDDTYTLTIRASEVIVNVDEDYFDNGTHTKTDRFEKYSQGLYIQYNSGENSTAVVYFYQGADNIHKLVTTDTAKGLVEKTIIPKVANGAYSVRIISGTDVAELISGDSSIRFKKTGRVSLQFISITNSSVFDVVDIFVENALNDNVFDISTDKSKLTNTSGNMYTTRADDHTIISLGLNSIRNASFDSTKVYMSASVTSVGEYGSASVDDEGYIVGEGSRVLIGGSEIKYVDYVAKYLTITPNTVSQGRGYALGGYEFTTMALPQDVEQISVKIKFGVYLDLSAFTLNSGDKLSALYTGDTLLGEKEITITIYNRATAVRMSSDVTVSAGVNANIQVNLETGYRNNSDSTDWQFIGNLTLDGDILRTNITGKDTVDLKLETVNTNAENLVEYAREVVNEYNSNNPTAQKQFTIWELFNVTVGYKLTGSGYLYQVNLILKDENGYNRLEKKNDGKWIFKLTASAKDSANTKGEVNIEFVPQQLDTFRLENYAKLSVSVGMDNSSVEAEYTSSESASSLIIPGASGLIKVYAEKDYAYCENIQISSDVVEIDGEQYFVRFQQMTYNRARNVYESYAGITTDGTTLNLAKVSYIENGVRTYTGVIFVRTILEKIVGVRRVFTITVTATTYDADGQSTQVSTSLALLSQYQPGVYVSVENALKTEKSGTEIYLVEKGSSKAKIVAKVYGYQFNVLPDYSASWVTDGLTEAEIAALGNADQYITIRQIDAALQESDSAYYITYELAVSKDCPAPFNITFNMTLVEDGNTLTSNTERVQFYPVAYTIGSARVDGVSNGNMEITIGSSRELSINWNHTSAMNAVINSDVKAAAGVDFLRLFYVQTLDGEGHIANVYFNEYTTKKTNEQLFQIVEDGGVYLITALNKGKVKVYFDIYYGYEFVDGEYSVKFSNTSIAGATTRIHSEFDLYLTEISTEDKPKPIRNAQDLREMAAGENYILFNDITVDDWVPLTNEIASLDGNGNVITIRSFSIAVTNSINAGLFAQVGASTILKNVVVNIGDYASQTLYINDENVTSSTIRFGFLAGVNNGLIYNCEVISLGKAKVLEIAVGVNYTLTFGGLVGQNNGNITNSRVGTEYFVDVEGSSNGVTSSTRRNCGEISIKSSGILAGFVGENTNTISSSYIANTSIENTQNKGNMAVNRTAGFVATNTGMIAYSYSKGLERSILTTRGRATGSKLYASGSGSVAGFVFENKGEIHDCYSNIICESNSAVAAGFVYDTTGGQIYQCYSASKVQSGNTDTSLATELPFVGIGLDKSGAQQLLSNDKDNMANCYYLNDGQEFDTNYIIGSDKYEPIALALTDFANPDYLSNFAFVRSGSSAQQLNGVWTYSTSVDKNKSIYSLGVTSLPELTSANKVAKSIRYEPDDVATNVDNLHDYPYALNYSRGSENNPYIIRSVDEYIKVFKNDDGTATSKVGYVRFIDNISFEANGNNIDIPTRANYILGDKDKNNITILDGNGMSIGGVLVNRANDNGSIGLFSEVHYAVVKGLNIEYASSDGSIGTSTVVTAGGFAGKAEDVFFIDIDLSGGVEVRANNVVGGLVGILTGKRSGIYNATSNLSAKAGSGTEGFGGTYASADNLGGLSYAGGLAGIIDIGNNQEYININKIEINSANIEANKAGGVAGYLGKNVYANRLTYVIGTSSKVFGQDVVGGMVGENWAKISLSQVGFALDTQHSFDKAFGAYVNNGTNDDAVEGTEYGNLNAVQGSGTVGGFIGVNNKGKINDSLTKANIGGKNNYGSPQIVGGFIGKMDGGELKNCYAQNYIDLADENEVQYVGGLFGQTGNSAIAIDNVVVATWLDKAQVRARLQANKPIDYIVGKDDGMRLADEDGLVSYGDYLTDMLTDTGKSVTTTFGGAQRYDMKSLYNLEASTQKEIFESLFILWDTNYWDLDNTKFMPNLKPDNAASFIELTEQEDLKKFNIYPNSNFILMNDIDVGEYNSNYIANIDFSGVLVGKMQEDGTYPRFLGITLNADTSRSVTSGFFKSTSKARIANVGFEYTGLNLNGSKFTSVGGVAAEDIESRYENITVSGKIGSGGATTISVGSLIGQSKRSVIINCSSSADIEATTGDGVSYVGGLVGSLDGTAIGDEAEVNTFDGLVRHSAFTGKIEVANSTSGTVYIGGAMGYSVYTTLSGNQVGSKDGQTAESIQNCEITFTSTSEDGGNAVVGGMIGLVKQITIMDSGVYLSATSVGANIFNVGGIVGQTQTSGVTIHNCHAHIEVCDPTATMSSIGGIVATSSLVAVDEATTKISEVYTELNISASVDEKVGYMTVGGIAATAGAIEIDKAIVNMNSCNAAFDTRFVGGGFIGQAQGNYKISNSISMGQLLANSTQTDRQTTIILGGMVGLMGQISDGVVEPNNEIQGSIKNSLTTLTLSTAGVYQGTVKDSDPTKSVSHTVIANAIVGQSGTQIVTTENVVYSSDYTLVFDNAENKFSKLPTNYTANVLLSKTSYQREDLKAFDNSGWIVQDGYLPIPNLTDLLVEVTILESVGENYQYSALVGGSSLNPIEVDEDNYAQTMEEGKDKYRYYIFNDTTVTLGSTIEKLNGVLLGCNTTVTGGVTLVNELTKHSAITNIVYHLNNNASIQSAGIAVVNNGTIFMCGIEYANATISGAFGGIASENNGTIAYCYNSGEASSVSGNAGGLVSKNGTFGSISYSYFIGVFNTSDLSMSAIANENAGYIGYCYSAGAAGSPIAKTDNEGRYEQNYFDYYANFILKDDYNSNIATGLSTTEMQATGVADGTPIEGKLGNNYYTTLWASNGAVNYNWLVYGINNVEFNAGTGVYQNTYNYGYPIHNFNQKVLLNGDIVDIPLRAKLTGDGTFLEVVDADLVEGKQVNGGEHKVYDDNSYLLPHFGLLMLVSEMPDTSNRYFELEFDLTMPSDMDKKEYYFGNNGSISGWTGIGNTTETAFKGVFSSIRPLADGQAAYELDAGCTTIASDEYGFNDIKLTATTPRKINNLTGEALFHLIDEGAVIANLELANSMVNAAPLVNSVGKPLQTADSGAQILIYNISISGKVTSLAGHNLVSGFVNVVQYGYKLISEQLTVNATITSGENGASTMSGLINTNEGRVELIKFNSSKASFEYGGNSSVTVAGIVWQNKSNAEGSSASITIAGDGASNLSVELSNLQSSEIESFSGVAYINSGDILATDFGVSIGSVEEECGILAGCVSIMKGGSIGGFNINFEADNNECKADLFGGVVGKLIGGSIGIAGEVAGASEDGRPIKVELKGAMANTYGGIVGSISKDDAAEAGDITRSIDNVQVSAVAGSTIGVEPIEASYAKAYGLIIGSMTATAANINYTLDGAVNFEVKDGVNVGGLIGSCNVSNFNFSNTAQQMGTIKGVENVGGFIGYYYGTKSLTFTGSTWMISADSSFATISVYASEDIKDEQDRANFGGLIGFWDCDKPLQASAVDGETGEESTGTGITIKNSNEVFTDIADLDNFKYTEADARYIQYVGGVVGLSKAGVISAENRGQIGVEIADVDINDNGGFSPLVGAAFEDIINLVYVGGVVGGMCPSADSDNTSISKCINNAAVSGRYAVGGVIGYAENVAEISGTATTDTETGGTGTGDEEQGVILGLINVGGVAGIIKNTKANPIADFNITSSVIGIINVGGVAGSATNTNIRAITVTSKRIKGNANVGGLVGDMTSGAIGINVIEEEESGTTPIKPNPNKPTDIPTMQETTTRTDTSASNGVVVGDKNKNSLTEITTVYGTVFGVTTTVEEDGKQKYKDYYYLPVNIGGVVGRLNASSASVSMYNTQTYARVETDRNYTIQLHGYETVEASNSKLTVSMIDNRIVNINALTDLDPQTSVSGYYPRNNAVRYTAMDTGIGGFIGVISGSAFTFDQTCVAYGEVYAEYGINVGGSVGYLRDVSTAIRLPSLSTDKNNPSKVAGNLFVGGYVGKVKAMSGAFFDKNSIGYVNVQKYRALSTELATTSVDGVASGNCVGGVFGYCVNGISGVNITSTSNESSIKIFNKADSSFGTSYVGGIVGRLDGSMSGCSIDAASCGAEEKDINSIYEVYMRKEQTGANVQNEIIQSYDTFNYGGLVGLANVPTGTSETAPHAIEGTHYYAFTVDTVQNQDFEQGTSVYSYNNSGANEIVSAIAHYVNKSHIKVSASKLNSLYDNDSKIPNQIKILYAGNSYKYLANCNPTNENYLGWAKEYTMFRTWNRVIPQTVETGDSVQAIYNAQYITAVFTDYTETDLVDGKRQTYTNNIIYTVYQPIGQSAMLYCKYGIAEYSADFDPYDKINIVDDDTCYNFEQSYEVKLGNLRTVAAEDKKYTIEVQIDGKKVNRTYSYESLVNAIARYDGSGDNLADIIRAEIDPEVEDSNLSIEGFRWADYRESVKQTYLADRNTDWADSYFWYADYGSNDICIGRDAIWKHIEDPEQLGTESKYWTDENKERREKAIGVAKNNAANQKYTFNYSYYKIDNYTNLGEAYFIFKTVYGWSPYGIYDNTYENIETYVEEDRTVYSNSGSLFEVSGVPVTIETAVYSGEVSDKTIWWIIGGTLAIIAAAVIMFVPGLREALVAVICNVAMLNGIFISAATIGKVVLMACILFAFAGVGTVGRNINVAMLASQDVCDNFVRIEDSSLGYSGSTYGRQMYWKDGELVAGQDGVLICTVEATILTEGQDPANNDWAVEMIKTMGDMTDAEFAALDNATREYYMAMMKKMFEGVQAGFNDKKFETMETYSCSQNASMYPADFNVKVAVSTADVGTPLCKALSAWGIETYYVPKYIKVDNEIYIHTATNEGQTSYLYENFEEARDGTGFIEALNSIVGDGVTPTEGVDYINNGGYMYVGYEGMTGVLSGDHENYVKETYGIDRTIAKSLTYKLTSGGIDTETIRKRKVKDGDLTLVEDSTLGDSDVDNITVFKRTKTINYYYVGFGDTERSGYINERGLVYVSRTAANLYVEVKGKYIEISSGQIVSSIPAGLNSTETYIYLKENGEGTPVATENKEVYYKVQKSSGGLPLSTVGKSASDYHYEYDKNGSIAMSVTYYFYNQYGDKNTDSNGGSVYNLQLIYNSNSNSESDENKLGQITTKLYKFDDNGKYVPEDNDYDDGKGYKTITYEQLTENWTTYCLWSIDKASYYPASRVYTLKGTILYSKQMITAYVVDEHVENGVTEEYLVRYAVDNRSADGINYWNYNKFLYTYSGDVNIRGGGTDYMTLLFYTRYKYEGNDNSFFNAIADSANDDAGAQTYSISSLLFDQRSVKIFAEGVRVSLSAGSNTVVYRQLKLDENGQVKSNSETISDLGSITCLM